MTGKVLGEFFDAGLQPKSGPPSSMDAASGESVYSDAEQKLVEQRLADLGYVD